MPPRAAGTSFRPSLPPRSRRRQPRAPAFIGGPSPTKLRPKVPKVAAIFDNAEPDVLTYVTFPKEHRAKLPSTNPIALLNGEIKRRADVVGIFPNDDAIVRVVAALLLEQNDEWAVQRARNMTLRGVGKLSDDPLISLPAVAR
jgi:putative transposase